MLISTPTGLIHTLDDTVVRQQKLQVVDRKPRDNTPTVQTLPATFACSIQEPSQEYKRAVSTFDAKKQLYVAGSTITKLGIAIEPELRTYALQHGCLAGYRQSLRLWLSLELDYARYYEHKLLKVFEQYRWRGEWLQLDPAVICDIVIAAVPYKRARWY